jgi:hypothetical protein
VALDLDVVADVDLGRRPLEHGQENLHPLRSPSLAKEDGQRYDSPGPENLQL